DPGRALPSAARLDTAAPASGHIVHMPAHIYARTGDQAGSARANASGAAADEKYLAAAPPDSMYGLMYYSHNLSFLSDAEMSRGRFKDALGPSQLLTRLLDGNARAAMFPMMESGTVDPLSVLLRFNKYDEVLALPEPAADKPVRVAWRHFARGIALARAGKTEEAINERTALMKAAVQIPDAQTWGGLGFLPARAAMDLAAVVLDARVAWAKGAHDIAIQLWRRAVANEDKVPYDEPPAWYYPMRE